MSYFSAEQSLGSPFGCGPECNCGPCKSGVSGLGQRYEAEEKEGLSFGYYGGYGGMYGDEAPAESRPEPAPVPAPQPEQRPASPAPGPVIAEPRSIEADQGLLREALSRGVRSPRGLTDIIFFARHPALKENPAWANDGALLDEWRQIRERLVVPAVRQRFAPRRPMFRPRRLRSVRLGQPEGSEEAAEASWAVSKQAAIDSYAKYKRDCTGVQVLSRLTKLDPYYEGIRLRKRIDRLPTLFDELRVLKENLKKDLQDPQVRKNVAAEIFRRTLRTPQGADITVWLQDAYNRTVARLLAEAGFPPGYYLGDLKEELARARCELSRNSWRELSLCNAMEELNPARFSTAVAQHFAKTELGISSAAQPVECKAGAAFCDVKFSNGVIIRVSLTNIPTYVVATQIGPKAGPQRDYQYSCFKGNVNLSPRKP